MIYEPIPVRGLYSLHACVSTNFIGQLRPRSFAGVEGSFAKCTYIEVGGFSCICTPYSSYYSPNAEEALSLLSVPHPPTRSNIEKAAQMFLDFGVAGGQGWVIIRSGQLGAYVKTRGKEGVWIDAFWTESEEDARHVVDVTGV